MGQDTNAGKSSHASMQGSGVPTDLADYALMSSATATDSQNPVIESVLDGHPVAQVAPTRPVREIDGRDGPEPTRFGDWEKNGRCIDF
jgi:hypothetical protein